MVRQGSGVILTITGGYREAFPTKGGFSSCFAELVGVPPAPSFGAAGGLGDVGTNADT